VHKVSKNFKIDAGKLFAFSLILVALTTAFSCSSPLIAKSQNAKADFTLNFLISDTAKDAVSKSLTENVVNTSGNEEISASRLLLNTAKTLVVSLKPLDSSLTNISPQRVALSSEPLTPVSFKDISYGSYTVLAEALGADGVTVLFTQTSTLVVKASNMNLSLNLVPANPLAIPVLTDQSINDTIILSDAASTWLIPKDSALLHEPMLLFTVKHENLNIYIQSKDGTLLAQASNTKFIATNIIPPNTDIYLTLYNTYGENIKLNFCASPILVPVPEGTFQRDGTVGNTSYVSAFSIGKYEVTRSQFSAIMGEDPVTSNSSGQNDPVQNVNYYQAMAFCNKLSIAEGLVPVYKVSLLTYFVDFLNLAFSDIPTSSLHPEYDYWNAVSIDFLANGYRLPTEMEWMWASMGAPVDGQNGGTNTTAYDKAFSGSTGTNAIGDYAWYNDNSGLNGTSGTPQTTHPVGTKAPNELGLYDMSGNVMEWTSDWNDTYPIGILRNYTGPILGTNRQPRGGSYISNSTNTKVDARTYINAPETSSSNCGFRVVRGISSDKVFAYVSNGSTNSISVYKFNQFTGAISDELSGSYSPATTSRMVIEPNKNFLFAATGANNTIVSLKIDKSSGLLTYADSEAAGTNPSDIVIDESGKFVYVLNSLSANISAYSFSAVDGSLTLIGTFPTALGGSPLSFAIKGSYLYCVTYFPGPDPNASALQSFLINASTGALESSQNARYQVSKTQNGIVIFGNYLYIGEGNSAGATSVLFNPLNGEITIYINSTPYIGWPIPDTVCMDPLGQYFFLPIGTNTLWIVPFTKETGDLGSSTNTGVSANYVSFDPTGKYLLAVDYTSLSSYVLDRSTGALSSTGFNTTTNPGSSSIVCVVLP